MKTMIQLGDTRPYTNSTGSAIASGDVVVVGSTVNVALADIPNGADGDLQATGVVELPKAAAADIANGSAPVWDASAGEFVAEGTALAAGDVSGAVTAWAAAGNGAETVLVKLNTAIGTVGS